MATIGLHAPALYLPPRRLTGAAVAAAFGGKAPKGARSVGAFDEDAVTMAIEAGARALEASGVGAADVDGLFFGTSTPPVLEKSVAALLVDVLGLPAGARAVDCGGGSRAGMNALFAALDAVAAGTCRRALVIAADRRTEAPGSGDELRVGDGAAAVVVAGDGPIAVRGRHSASDPFAAAWRREGEPHATKADARLAAEVNEVRVVPAAIGTALRVAGWAAGAIGTAACAAPDARAGAGVLSAAGLPKTAIQPDALAAAVGHLGAAHPLALLATLVGGARAGTKLLFAAGGDGADALCLEATAPIPPLLPPGPTTEVAHYGLYLRGRGLLPAPAPSQAFTSPAMAHRDQAWMARWTGRRCEGCGTVHVLPLPACHRCHGERFAPVNLARTGTVFTATREHYFPSAESPTGMAVVDLDGGGRGVFQVADAPADTLTVGAKVRLIWRKYHDAGGWPHYFWKALASDFAAGVRT